jgi:hypothetical protein
VNLALRCPVCRAGDNRGPQCRRCKADLALLWRLEEERERGLQAARRHAGLGQAADCLRAARRANLLRSDADSLELLAVAHLLLREYAKARSLHRRLRPPPGV